jgi:hypothetical protein
MKSKGLRQQRCEDYAQPGKWVSGIANQEEISYWSKRAEGNSKIAPRATNKDNLKGTGGDVRLRDTASAPIGFGSNPFPDAKGSGYGSSYMESVRNSGRGKVVSGGKSDGDALTQLAQNRGSALGKSKA